MEVEEHLDLSPMRGMGDIFILNHMCSSMGYPHIELPSNAYSGSKLELLPFDVDHKLVASFVIFR